MSELKFIWTDEYIGGRKGPLIPEEGDRTRPYSDRYWSKIEILPPDRIKEIQWERLKYLINFAFENSLFYRKRWMESGVSPSEIKDLDDIVKLPIITKQDMEEDQASNPPWGTIPTSPPNTHFQYYQTSGTTGKPRIWSATKQDVENQIEVTVRSLYAEGIRPGWRGFFAFSFPPFMGFWHIFYASAALGCQNVPKGPIPTEAWLKLIQNLAGDAPSFLLATPTYLIRQLEVSKKIGIDPHKLKINKLLMSGEPGYAIPATHNLLRDGWNAQPHEHMGTTEVGGPVLFSCEELADLPEPSDHINSDYWLVEVLDPETRKPVEPDKNGEKSGISCITALTQYGMPVIRLLIGDYLTVSERERCKCGRSFPIVKGGLKTRPEDMIVVKGVNIYPSLIENSVRSIKGLAPEYFIKLKGGRVIILVEAEAGVPKSDYERLVKHLQSDIKEKTMVTLDIEIKEPGTLPKGETKVRRIIKE